MKFIMIILIISVYTHASSDKQDLKKSAQSKTKKYRDFIAAMKILEKIERDVAIEEITSQLPKEIIQIIQAFDTP